MVWPSGVWCDMVREVAVRASSVPESVARVFDVVEVPGGCPWRYGGRHGKPWWSLQNAFSVCEEGGAYSEEDAARAIVRAREVGGGAGGSWRVLIDVVESSAEESVNCPLGGRKVV